jgi:NOL1/NOP2/fmu family ribosome biogenesis protein
VFYNIDTKIIAFNNQQVNELLFIRTKFNCLMAGIELFEVKGKDFIPAHQLALLKILDKSTCMSVAVDYETAIAYLKREAISLPEAQIGYLLITFKGLALGWVKNIGNRCNNLYPQHWRIRMNL